MAKKPNVLGLLKSQPHSAWSISLSLAELCAKSFHMALVPSHSTHSDHARTSLLLSSELSLWKALLFELVRLFIFGLETGNLEFPKATSSAPSLQ